MSITYKESGVDINAGNEAVELIKEKVKETFKYQHAKMIAGLGGFSGAVELPDGSVVAASTDGVGTKLRLAQMLDKHDTIGIDLVAMCVNERADSVLMPIMFQDYIALVKQIPERTKQLVNGMVVGCKQASVVLSGGEMAEMPGMYDEGSYDLAGFAVGYAKSKDEVLTGEGIRPGMKVYGFESSGVHSNGFSLIYKVISSDKELTKMGDELITPTLIYVDLIKKLRLKYSILGMVHITGGGLVENPPRIMPNGCAVHIDLNSWKLPRIFKYIKDIGKIDAEEMRRTFNMGLGLLVISPNVIEEGIEVGEIIKSNSKATQFTAG